jgi:hypothetical protein
VSARINYRLIDYLILALALLLSPKNAIAQTVEVPQVEMTIQEYAKQEVIKKWKDEKEFDCLNTIVIRESNWDYKAKNPNSSATGIPQALVITHKLGKEFLESPEYQVDWMISYLVSSYKTPCNALSFWNKNKWY